MTDYAFVVILFVAGPVLYSALSIVKREKDLADAETIPLPSSTTAFLSVRTVMSVVLVSLLVFFLCSRLLFAIGEIFKFSITGLVRGDGFHLSLAVLALFLMLTSGSIAIRNLADLLLRTRLSRLVKPTISVDQEGITFEETRVPWSQTENVATYVVSAPRGGSWSYAIVAPQNDSLLSQKTFKSRSWSLLCSIHRREVRRNLNLGDRPFFLFPLYGLTESELYLIVMLHRFWAAASGHGYKPVSIEARYPQKRFEDYVQK